ncbi:DNA-methyltransferase [Pseudomonas aeruginosa]|uniref:DNA-methyltransferase n=1 Tax=Pseudomonas aeruginosa TaxID=287 RepID=UPI0021F0FEF2|nr:site-specific DNA-methyltransferase [Pseudomonas aeruginosa]MCV4115273.1 site-specific DNA-methyltransferase [Pseudomonas aeruginosa]MCV4244328.1 site-specific DNA-methyltransferase [Pseudomonas aeruginosa]MCV4253996.1 site-specific DNA-methyltransferase [Pseudomonas aeruginosa]
MKPSSSLVPYFKTDHGAVFDQDCLVFLRGIKDSVVDTVFADPPFNLKKEYGAKSNDDIPDHEYLAWCREWINEAVRTLKPGGAFFLYNLPKWNMFLGTYMAEAGLEFRHWIAVDIKFGLPIQKRLYPSHYSLLYFTKGKPKTFRKVRTPIELCRHCKGEIKDYGGHRNKMNPKGVNLTDVWNDIAPVRHWKYKSSERKANALSSKLLDRVVEISTEPGDLVIDPFGGSGTTFAVCETKHRRWLGTDIDFAPVIKERLTGDLFLHKNTDVLDLD